MLAFVFGAPLFQLARILAAAASKSSAKRIKNEEGLRTFAAVHHVVNLLPDIIE
jgi:hypothetical protein